MPSTVSTKKISAKKKGKKIGRPKTPGLADKIRCWHRYDQDTLDKLQIVKNAMLKDVPFFFHGHVDDPSIISALILKAHKEVGEGSFKVSDYIIATTVPPE